jgi:hypothetical protein
MWVYGLWAPPTPCLSQRVGTCSCAGAGSRIASALDSGAWSKNNRQINFSFRLLYFIVPEMQSPQTIVFDPHNTFTMLSVNSVWQLIFDESFLPCETWVPPTGALLLTLSRKLEFRTQPCLVQTLKLWFFQVNLFLLTVQGVSQLWAEFCGRQRLLCLIVTDSFLLTLFKEFCSLNAYEACISPLSVAITEHLRLGNVERNKIYLVQSFGSWKVHHLSTAPQWGPSL